MKFQDLAIGQRFKLDGAYYVKTSPVLASREEGGEKKFLARYVPVQPLDGAEHRPAKRAGKTLQAEAVLAAFAAYHERCQKALERLAEDIPRDKLNAVMDVMEDERQGFIDTTLNG